MKGLLMIHDDRNRRTAGFTRTNARTERDRVLKAPPPDPEAKSIPPVEIMSTALEEMPCEETLVLFLTQPPEPTSEQLQIAAENAFSQDNSTLHRDGWEFSVRWAARSFTYHPESCIRKKPGLGHMTFAMHSGWLAVDIVAAPTNVTETDRLNALGRLLSELVVPEPVAVYRPSTDESLPFTPDVEQLLREGRIGEVIA
ncbi:MAG: hypothetical protein ACRC8S_01225 [Fimbriiglobus sp.]